MTTAVPQTDDQLATRGAGRVRSLAGVAVFSDAPAELAALWSELLGVEFAERRHDDGREHHITSIGAMQLEIKASLREDGTPTPDALPTGGPHSNVELSFTVCDCHQTHARALQLGFREHAPVQRFAWGSFGTVLDPEGNRLGFFTPPPAGANG